MIHNQCGTELPTDVGAVVTHLAECPHGTPELSAWCRHIVSAVSRAADVETPAVSSETPVSSDETPPVSPAVSSETRETPGPTPRDTAPLTPARMAELRDGGMSLRDIAALAGIGHETVRRHIARHRAGQIIPEQ